MTTDIESLRKAVEYLRQRMLSLQSLGKDSAARMARQELAEKQEALRVAELNSNWPVDTV